MKTWILFMLNPLISLTLTWRAPEIKLYHIFLYMGETVCWNKRSINVIVFPCWRKLALLTRDSKNSLTNHLTYSNIILQTQCRLWCFTSNVMIDYIIRGWWHFSRVFKWLYNMRYFDNMSHHIYICICQQRSRIIIFIYNFFFFIQSCFFDSLWSTRVLIIYHVGLTFYF